MNREDQKVALAVKKAIPHIARAVDLAVKALTNGGRLIYIGAGTSGRLGVLDAAECRPTFGSEQVLAVIAGGPKAMLKAGEGAEDDRASARRDLQSIGLSKKDVLVGLTASGQTPYTLEGLRYAKQLGAGTVGVTANPAAAMRGVPNIKIVTAVGPEIVAGSSRLKAGTAEKLVLNMLSTATMVRLGRVLSGWMINVQLTNNKLRARGCSILMKATAVDSRAARRALDASGNNLPAALLMIWKNASKDEAMRLLNEEPNIAGVLRRAQQEYNRRSSPARASNHRRRRNISRRSS